MFYSALPTAIIRSANYIRSRCRRQRGQDKRLCLTFDDGPSREYTPELLRLLRKYNIKATFFVVASFAEDNPDIIASMKADGHDIGLHSLEHRFGMLEGPRATVNDLRSSCRILDRLGLRPNIIRPPWGTVNLALLREIRREHLKLVLWTVMAGDWRGDIDSDAIAKKLDKKVKPGSLMCLHDGRGENGAPGRTIKALEKMLPIWVADGYQFVKVEELYERKKA